MLTGRGVELDQLGAALDKARAGSSGARVITGEAGMGKTSLVQAIRDQATDFLVLSMRGIESESTIGGAGLLELLQPVLDRLDGLPGPLRGALLGVLGFAEPKGDQFAVSAALTTLLSTVALDRPLLVVVDDVQWLDTVSARAVTFAARRLHQVRILSLITARDGVPTPMPLDGLDVVRLGPLDDVAATRLVASVGVPEARRPQVLALASGNPLALVELSRETGEAASLFEDVADRLFGARIEALGHDERSALLAACLYSHDDAETLAAVAGSAPLASLAAAGLVRRRADRAEVRHPLVRELVLLRASESERRRTHAALAVALPPGDERTRHRSLAAVQPDARLADDLHQLADRSTGTADGVWALARAAALTPSGSMRSDRLRQAAAAAFEARDMPVARQLMSVLDSAADPVDRADAAVLHGRMMIADGALVEGARLIRQAAETVAVAGSARSVRLLAEVGRTLVDAGRVDEALPVIERARSSVPPDEPVLRLLVESVRAEALVVAGHVMPALLAYQAAAAVADREPAVHGERASLISLAEALHSAWWHDRAREVTVEAARLARRDGALGDLRYILSIAFSIEFTTGRIGDARVAATEELELATDCGLLRERREALGHVAWCDAYAGREDDCRRGIRERRALRRRMGEPANGHASEGVLYLGLGRFEAAADVFAAELEEQDAAGDRLAAGFSPIAANLVEAWFRAGREREAAALLARFRADAEALGRPHALSLAYRCEGLMAAPGSFDDAFALALEQDLAEPRPLERARTLLCWGERLRRARRRGTACERLTEALGAFTELQVDLYAERATAELAAAGVRTPGRTAEPITTLTPQERQISLLVAEGLTNREVATRLFISTNTVETHMRHMFTKLGVRSRTELARKITDFGDSARTAPP